MIFAGLLASLLWSYGVLSCCMCFYVLFSSGEGIYWFTCFHNYLLIFGATGACASLPFAEIPSSSLRLSFTCWSFYAMLVTAHYWRFKLIRRHILPVLTPLAVLFAIECSRQLS